MHFPPPQVGSAPCTVSLFSRSILPLHASEHCGMTMHPRCLWLGHAVLQMASARGSLAPLGGSSFTFNNPLGDTEMADAAHVTPNFHDNRWDLYALHTMHGSDRQVI